MTQREIRFQLGLCLVGVVLSFQVPAGPSRAQESESGESSEPVLLGLLSREDVEAAVPDWFFEQSLASPDIEAADALVMALSGAEVTVYLGTWCSDSRRELSRLWRALDEIGVLSPAGIRYIGVDRDKREPVEWIGDTELLLVPTFVVRRDGQEVGRIVETARDGIERDLAALLRGEKTGLISGSEELEKVANDH